ncbi:MAG TPA: hypothetical protein VFI75_07970, partial [Candidatus Acidoferrum sp.]|nr:hypothetical protein [Candidatus Acidoferrum sp.]
TSVTLPYWIKVSRTGNTFTNFTSPDGLNWTQRGTGQIINMAQTVYLGLVVNSGSASAITTAVFDNVSITFP